MHLRTLLCCCLLLLAISAQAQTDTEYLQCKQAFDARVAKHWQKAEKIFRKHDERLTAMLDKFTVRHAASPAVVESALVVVERMSSGHEFATAGEDYRGYLDDYLKQYANPEKPPINCPSRKNTDRIAEGWVDKYEARLGRLLDAIDERLGLEEMKDDEGLVIIAFRALGYAERIRINRRGSITGTIEFGPVQNRLHFQIMKVKAGTYNWDEVSRETFLGRSFHDYGDRNFSFTVTPHAINYVGVFVYDSEGDMARGSLNDRASIILARLTDDYPELLANHKLVNGLNPNDRFLQYYFAERARHAVDDADE